MELSEMDRNILEILQAEGRVSNAELARRINLSPPATLARVRRLEEDGIIRRYAALLEPETVGYDMTCFISVSLQMHTEEQVGRFRDSIQEMAEVLECHFVTGEFDYLLKVVVRNRAALEQFVVNRLTPIPGVARIYTSLVLTEVKSNTALPFREPPLNEG